MNSGGKKNLFPPGFVNNLQDVLNKKGGGEVKSNNNNNNEESVEEPSSSSDTVDDSKPIVLVTNGDGSGSPGLTYLVQALVRQGLYNVHVCAPESSVNSFFFLFSFSCLPVLIFKSYIAYYGIICLLYNII